MEIGNPAFNLLMNNKPTRILDKCQSQIDHFYTNYPGKIKSIEQDDDTLSDHSVIIATRQMKINNSEEKYQITRRYEKIDDDQINNEIFESEQYFNILEQENPDIIAEQLIEMITEKLDNQSKLTKVKISNDKDIYNS